MILFVDDENFILQYYRSHLGDLSYPYLMCNNVLDAKQIIEDEKSEIKLVITDLHMKGENGYDLLKWLHEYHPGIRKVVLSAHSHEPQMHSICKNCDVEALLRKPVDVEQELIPIIKIIMSSNGN